MLTPDTRPLTFDELTEVQHAALDRIVARLVAILDDNTEAAKLEAKAPKGRLDGQPWAKIDTNRSHRNLMIDGERGTGKTSVLLTLIHEWTEATRRRGEDTKRWRGTLGAIASRIAFLQPVDFDPLPPGVPLLAWLLGSLLPVAKAVDSHPRSGKRDGAVESWQKLHRALRLGWEGRAPGAPTDLDTALLEAEQQLKDWRALADDWTKFVEILFEGLSKQHGSIELIVVPIDDCDLQVKRANEVLNAIRTLHHPKIVFLLTGDAGHLRDRAITQAFDELGGERSYRAGQEATDWGRVLARLGSSPSHAALRIGGARYDKSLAADNIVRIPLLTLAEALKLEGGRLAKALAALPKDTGWRGGLSSKGPKVPDRLQLWEPTKSNACLRVRSLTQGLAGLGKAPDSTEVLDILIESGWMTESGPVDVTLEQPRFLWTHVPQVTLAVGARPSYRSAGSDDRVSSAALLQHELTSSEPGPFPGPVSPVVSVFQSVKLPWPLPASLQPRRASEIDTLFGLWRDTLGTDSLPSADAVAAKYIQLLLKVCAAPSPTSGGASLTELFEHAWAVQDTTKTSAPGQKAIEDLTYYVLPLLGAPEFGLSDSVRELLLLGSKREVAKRGGDASLEGWGSALTERRLKVAADLRALDRLDTLWGAIVSMVPFVDATQPQVLWQALPGFSGHGISPWMFSELNALLRNGRPSRWTTAFASLEGKVGTGGAEVAAAVWRAFLDAATPPGEDASVEALAGWFTIESGLPVWNGPPIYARPSAGAKPAFERGVFVESSAPRWESDLAPPAFKGSQVLALALFVQSIAATGNGPIEGVDFERQPLDLGVVSLPPPLVNAWVDHDIAYRQAGILREAIRSRPPGTNERERVRWAVFRLADTFGRNVRDALGERFHLVTQIELNVAKNHIVSSPTVARWWGSVSAEVEAIADLNGKSDAP